MSMRRGDWASWTLQGLLLLAPGAIALSTDDRFLHDSMTQVLLFAILAQAWNILGGYARQISVGHVAFFGIGAYTSTLLYLSIGLSPLIGMLLGGALAALAGLLLGVVTFRLRGKFFTLATLAFAEVARILAVNMRSVTKGSEGVTIPYEPAPANLIFSELRHYVLVAWVIMLGLFVVSLALEHSKTGLRLNAYREDEDAARAVGIRTVRLRLFVVALSAFFTAIGGTFYAQYLLFIDPDSVFGVHISLEMALMAVVGGIGSAIGPVLGTYLVVPFGQILRAELGAEMAGLHLVIYGLGLILVLYKLPSGVWPALERLVRRPFSRPTTVRESR